MPAKIAIIGGGGAGLAAAWLLEERHDVTLFEQSDRLGGHAQTLTVDVAGEPVLVSPGFHFFSRRMYPRFVRLLEHLAVPLLEYEQTCTFFDRATGRAICLPPTGGLARAGTLLGAGALPAMLTLRKLLAAAEPLVEGGDWSIPFGDFVERLGLPRRVVSDFVLPFFGSNWGVRTDEIAGFSARAVLSYATLHRPEGLRARTWTEIDGGMQRYVRAMREAASRTRVLSDRRAIAVRREAGAYSVDTTTGAEGGFDHVVFATNAREASAALSALPGAEGVRAILDRFEYFETRIAVHRDASLLPPDRAKWSIVNLARDETFCAIHHWAGWRQRADVFRSWVTHYTRPPRDVAGEVTYQHGKPTPSYYAAQARLAELQGLDGLWFSGVYTQGFDSHESAVGSAIDVARKLGESGRLAILERA